MIFIYPAGSTGGSGAWRISRSARAVGETAHHCLLLHGCAENHRM